MRIPISTRFIQCLIGLLSCALLTACSSGPRAAQLSDRQVKAMAMWQERCKKSGEFIHKTVDNVEGIYLMKVRDATNFGDQFRLDDPYGHDATNNMYLLNFLQGFYHQRGEKLDDGSQEMRIDQLTPYAHSSWRQAGATGELT